ncbi:hypothetical protein [Bacteroides sp. 224]|uniref:hypothetical protein n=1 Tax=Bacteroides sp. 224 TaxID=2302936 RepID=UPI0013D0DC6D|nr:hypothetical protein [Bacteroides sp. 224]NDV64520.1 hypothetical protein [Bacteroides sp. 224]
MKKAVLLFVLLLGANIYSFAQNYIDVLYLKDGSIIKGHVLEQIPDKTVKIQTYDGSVFVYNMDRVEKILKENNYRRATKQEYAPKKSSLRGYKGFVDFGYAFMGGDYDDWFNLNHFEVTTTHGYQFNNHIFVGGGMGYRYYTDIEKHSVPIYANFRANFLKSKVSPFVDVRTGGTVGDVEGGFATIGGGVRIGLAGRTALNLSLSYSYQSYDEYDFGWHYYDNWYYDSESHGVSLKLGFEF